jgi:predicted DNA-binding mobile mystery protein A
MRSNPRRLTRQREQLDAKLEQLRPFVAAAATPREGWLKSVRESLGMRAAQMAKRIGTSKQSVLALETSEVKRTASLQSLDRAARALGCTLAFAIVPDRPLAAVLEARARAVARRKLARVGHSMALEAQQPPPALTEIQIDELAREIKQKLSRELWDEP